MTFSKQEVLDQIQHALNVAADHVPNADHWCIISNALHASLRVITAPIDIILHCPNCGTQHIDEPEICPVCENGEVGCDHDSLWTNPPHRSHFCSHCRHIWRPADVPTNGVKEIKTKGKDDSPIDHTDSFIVQLRLQIQETLRWKQKAQEYRERLIVLEQGNKGI